VYFVLLSCVACCVSCVSRCWLSSGVSHGADAQYSTSTLYSTSPASQETIVRLLDLTRLNEFCLTSSFD